MDSSSDVLMIDTDDTNPQNPAQAALAGSQSSFVANNGLGTVRLVMFLSGENGAAVVNSVAFNTRSVTYMSISFYNEDTILEEMVRIIKISRIIKSVYFRNIYIEIFYILTNFSQIFFP